MNLDELRVELAQNELLIQHPSAPCCLINIVTGETMLSDAGFPQISDKSFRSFIQHTPHLFTDGLSILEWLDQLSAVINEFELEDEARDSVKRAIKVLQNIVYTAAVTAPTDLWILIHVFSTHQKLGILEWFLDGRTIIPEEHAEKYGLDAARLKSDLKFLHVRGYLNKGDGDFSGPLIQEVRDVLSDVPQIEFKLNANIVPILIKWLSGESETDEELLIQWARVDSMHQPTGSWIASLHQVEIGCRVLPIVLALRVLELTEKLKTGTEIISCVPRLIPEVAYILETAGIIQNGIVTKLGARVFERAPGPFGIIHAYYNYVSNLDALLQGDPDTSAWVKRGANVAASQDANRKTFDMANDRLDKFCEDYDFRYNIFIEHAVGQGEAIRQRFERDGGEGLKYFGADLEPKAIETAKEQQQEGLLPSNLEFICPADIGEPAKVIDYLTNIELDDEPTILMVGNGFHEIRNQTNEKMIEVFRQYQEAGYIAIFTEESALNDEALLQTAWNTYHSGFRYVHQLSGQGLRPARGTGLRSERWSWRRCASLGGYLVLDEYSFGTRTIYPYPRPADKNPSISETFFCIPYKLALKLGIEIAEV
jgi:hypothetical protein